MAKNMPSPDVAAASWKTGFGGSNTKWQAGVNAVSQAPGIAAAAAADLWEANTIASKPKFQSQVAKVTLGDWKTSCGNVNAGTFQTGAQKGVSKYQAKIGPVLQAISQIRDSLPPRGDIMTNLARAQQMALELHNRAQRGF